jgi:hypothetical protein
MWGSPFKRSLDRWKPLIVEGRAWFDSPMAIAVPIGCLSARVDFAGYLQAMFGDLVSPC